MILFQNSRDQKFERSDKIQQPRWVRAEMKCVSPRRKLWHSLRDIEDLTSTEDISRPHVLTNLRIMIIERRNAVILVGVSALARYSHSRRSTNPRLQGLDNKLG
jgi:hypothetical protein